jgi:DNA invertase Pin-like site-specific DNA recombinase
MVVKKVRRIAYSYIRFSSPEQAKGDSLRRQLAKARAYCQRHGYKLDEDLTFRDLGVSAFRGDNAFNGNLGVFLKAVANGTVKPGAVLIVESIDRISRQGIDEGADLIKKILKAGIILVTLTPEREFDVSATKGLTKGWLEILIILERAAEESEMKAERSRCNWEGKREKFKNGELKVVAGRLPAWVQVVDGELEPIMDKAAIVKQLFEWAIAGYGTMRIVAKLQAAEIPTLSGRDHWSRSYVALILNDRRAVGDYQPKDRKGQKAGEVIKDYYPAIVSEDEYALARSSALHKKRKAGRVAKHINLFAGLLKNARHGDSYYAATRTWYGRQTRLLINHGSKEGTHPSFTFPLPSFEEAVCELINEIDPHTILNGDARPDESLALAAEKARVEARIAALEQELLEGDLQAATRALRILEAQNRDLGQQLDEARHQAAHPLSETWGEVKGLLATARNATDPDAALTRLQAGLRSIIAEVWMLVVPLPNHDRICAVQIFFNTDDPKKQRRRDYLILHRPGRNNGTPAAWWCRSLSDLIKPDDFDLRRKEHAAELAGALERIDVAALLRRIL